MLTWKQVLFELIGMSEPIRVVDVAHKLGRQNGEMSARLDTLRKWGYIKYADRIKKGYGGFVVTEWGKECAKRWKRESDSV